MSKARTVVLRSDEFDAVVFDMDGVVTKTAAVHATAWKRLFDDYMEKRSQRTRDDWRPFDMGVDYRQYVDGKPRYDGVRSFLASRDIVIPEGTPDDATDADTVCGLGNRKNGYFLEELKQHGVGVFESTIRLVRILQGIGLGTAIISASRNVPLVLGAGGVGDLFPVCVDGTAAAGMGLPGKPNPAVFLEAASRLGASIGRTIIVEDARAGVEAGRRGGFGLVLGIDRTGDAEGLLAAGADVIVSDLADVVVDPPFTPSALTCASDIKRQLSLATPGLFLDYDGTLTPIVQHPDLAILSDDMRAVLERLATRYPVAILSGRDLANVRRMVGIEGIVYAGSHGLDIEAPEELGGCVQQGLEAADDLAAARGVLTSKLEDIAGAWVEPKTCAVTVHYRQAPPDQVPRIMAAFDEVASVFPGLRRTTGKMILELRPDTDWDKGKTLLWLLERLEATTGTHVPVYVGDDVTDEDAFQAIAGHGVGVHVGDPHDVTAADYNLADTRAVLEFFHELLGLEGPP
ncbi:MAG: trehalose-phosphatase [Halobacteriota archaeon]